MPDKSIFLTKLIASLVPKFFETGTDKVYVAFCCNRLAILLEETHTCKTCDKAPKGFWVRQDNFESDHWSLKDRVKSYLLGGSDGCEV